MISSDPAPAYARLGVSEARGEERATVLVVEDEAPLLGILESTLATDGYRVLLARDAEEAQRVVRQGQPPEVVLLDINLPGMSGVDLLQWLRSEAEGAQVVMSTGVQDLETVRYCLREGAYDYLLKPFDPGELVEAVGRAVERGRQVDRFRRHRERLETTVKTQSRELESTRDMAILAMARLAESRDRETGTHLERIAEYSRILAEALRNGAYADRVTDRFVKVLRRASPLHDIGKVGVPDAILLKEGALTAEEREVIRGHARIGGDTLRKIASGSADDEVLEMAIDIAYQHHERWDGTGYPAGLAGEEISLAARVVALVDAYDAITSDRPYKRAFEHKEAVRRVVVDRGEHFDPVLVDAFLGCHREFDRVRRRLQAAEG